MRPTIRLNASSDTGVSQTDRITRNTQLLLSGTANPNALVTIFDGSDVVGTVLALPNGSWQFETGLLDDGLHNLTAVTFTSPTVRETSAALAVTVDTTTMKPSISLAASSDSGASSTDNLTNKPNVILNGGGEVGARIEIRDGAVLLGTTTVNTLGKWQFNATNLTEGEHRLTATAIDKAGNVAQSDSLAIRVDRTLSAPSIQLQAGSDSGRSGSDFITRNTSPTVVVASEAGATVQLSINGAPALTAVAAEDGRATFQLSELPDGAYRISATATDRAGNTRTTSTLEQKILKVDTSVVASKIDLTASSDTGESATDNVTAAQDIVLNGNTEVDATVILRRDGVVIANLQADATGRWTFIDAGIPEKLGAYIYTASIFDIAGNTAQVTTGVVVDRTAPRKPTFDLPSSMDTGASTTDNVTSLTLLGNSLVLTGTAEAGRTVEIFRDGVATPIARVVSVDGTWSHGFANASGSLRPAADGTVVLRARTIDLAGNATMSDDFTLRLDSTIGPRTIDLLAASDTGISDTDNFTADRTPVFTGTAEAGARVELFIDGVNAGTVTADASGVWSLRTNELAPGAHSALARTTDVAGNTGNTSPLAFTITGDPRAPTIDLAEGSDTGLSRLDGITFGRGNPTTQQFLNPVFTGTASAGATVSVIEGGTTLGTVVANSAGRWTLQMPDGSPLLSEGQHEITAISIDRAGVTTTSGPLEITIDRSTTFNASSLSIDNSIRLSTTAFETSDADLVLRGIADEPGSLIHVLLGNVVIGFSGTGPTGSWSIPLPPLSDGLQRLKVVTTDIAGNKAGIDLSILVDSTTQAPTIDLGSSSDTGVSSSDNITNRDILTLSGTAEGRSVVTIFDGETAIGTATPRGGSATTNGAWTFSASGLAEGVHNLRVEALDAFGLRQVSDTLAVTIDRTAPGKPTLVLDAASDSGLSNTDNITNASILTLRGIAEPGVRVELLRDAPTPQVASGFATADASGNFSFSISADRMIAAPTGFIVQAVDTAGNISRSDPLKVTIDTAGPTAGTPLLSTSSDTGISATDNLTHDTTPTFIGRTEAGARVELKIDGAIAGTAFADAAGDWSITAPGLAAGLHTAMTTITDVGGNGTDSRTRSFTIDDATVSPTIDLTASYDSGRSSTDNNTRIVDLDSSDFAPLFQGTAEALASVTVSFGGRQITTTANALGLWSVAGSQFASLVLAEGLHDVSVSATDRAGNVASGVPLQITLDSTAPARFNVLLDPASDSGAPDGPLDGGVAASYLTNDLTPTFTGVTEAFSEVRLIRNGAGSIGSTIADAQGAWSFTPANPIGSHGQSIAVDASVTDLAGNVSAAFGALIRFDTVAPNISITTPNFAATDTTPDIAGVTEAGATVEIFRSRQGEAGVRKLGETTAAADGGWQFTAPELVDGFYSFYATATDVAGNMRPSTVLFRTIEGLVVRPTIDLMPQSDSGQSSTDNVTNANVLSLSGTAAPNAAVVVQTLSGGHFVETTADSSGVWRADLGGLGEGSISIVASEGTLAAPSTNTSTPLTVTIDRTATVTAIDLGTGSDTGFSPTDNITSDATPSFFLTASEPNFLDPSRGSFGEVLIDGSGSPIALGANLSVTLPSLVDGAHFIESRLVDRAGNVSTQRLDFVIDTTTVAPTLALDAGQDTGNSATDGITRIPTMAFVGTAEPGALVQIVVEGTAADGSAVNGSFSSFFVDATGTFQRSMPQGLPDGTYVLTARATDIAGNEAVSAPFNVTLDTLTPVPTLGLAPDVPTINFKGLPYVTASSFAVQGTAEAGATVTVSDGGIVLGTALAAGDGTWSFDVSGRAPGPRSLSAVAVDVAGNSAASASLAFGAALTGNAFDNLLIGTANDEVILGLGANDVLRGLAGDDLLDGGEGSDTADYSVGPTGSVTANLTLAGPQAIGGDAGADTLVSIENLIGSNFNDTLIGDAGNNVLEGGVGNDDLFGGAGLDTASYASASGAVEVKLLKNPAAGQPNGLTFFFGGGLAAGSDRLFDIENLTGSGFNDRLEGDDRDNVLSGGAGNDTLTGGAGNDVLNGGEGNDTLIGNVGNNVLNGGAGDDTILDGNDGVAATTTATTTIDAGSGDDRIEIASTVFASGSIDGGEGTNVLLGANATLTNLTLSNIEILETQVFTVIGRAAQFEAFDTIRHSAADLTTRVVLTLAVSGTATTLDLADELALAGGGGRAVLLTGSSDNETITTGAGNDTVNAGNGNDTVDGGAGNDTLTGGAGNDVLNGGEGDDTLIGNVGNNVLNGGAGDDTILDGNDGVAATTTATTAIDAGTGDDRIEIASTVFASGSIDGGEGTDVLLGANATLTNLTLSNIEILEAQVFTVIGRAAQFEAFDTIRHSAADLTTRVVLTLAVSGTATTLDLADELALAGGGGRAVILTGSSDNETITTGAGNDIVNAGNGNDTLDGSDGNDTLNGGEGDDTLDGSDGNDTVNGNNGNDTLDGGAGNDTILDTHGVGAATATTAIDAGTGDDRIEIASTVFASGSIDGGEGTDVLLGANATLTNLTLSNIEILETQGLAVIGRAAQFETFDTILRSATDLPTGVTLTLAVSGTATTLDLADELALAGGGGRAVTLTGSSDNETITTGAGNDTVNAGNGNDRLDGGAGNDTLTGGEGDDTLDGSDGNDTLNGNNGNDVLDGGAGNDTILDTHGAGAATATTAIDAGTGDDRIEIASTVFASGSIDGGEGKDVLLGANATLTNLTLSNIEILETQGLAVIGRAAQFETFDTILRSANDLPTGVTLTLAVSGTATTLDLADELALAGGGGRAIQITGTTDDETITTGAGNDTLSGGLGNDKLSGGGGNDTLNGGSGADRFVFGPGGGADTVQDFLRGTDKIDLTAYASQGIVGRADLSFTDLGSNTRISFADGSTITLNGVSDPALLTDSDFIFGAALTPIGAFDAPGEIMPNLPFVGSDGAAINLLDTAGGARFLVLSVCAEWCTPCFGYSADLGAVAANAGPDFAFVEVLIENQDQQLSQTADALQWRDRFGLTIPVLTTDGDAQAMTNFVRGVNAAAIPLYFVIDAATGEIVDRSAGYNTVNERVRELLDISGGTHPVFGAAPVVQNDAYVVDQDQTTAIALSVLANDSDPEGNALIASLVAGPAHGSLELFDDGTFTYTPQTGYTGSDFFTYRASDSFNFSEIGTVALTIEVPDDDPPTAIAIDGLAANIRENDPNGFVAVGQVRVIDPDVQPEFRNNPVTLSGDPRVALSGDQLFVFADAIDFDAGDTEITFTLSTGPISRTVTIPVLDQNEAPVAVDDGPFQVSPGQDLSIHVLDLLANDSDVNAGAVLEIYAVDDAVNGTVALIDDHVVFQADNIASAEGSFSYFVRDNQGGTSGATVLLNIQPFDVFL